MANLLTKYNKCTKKLEFLCKFIAKPRKSTDFFAVKGQKGRFSPPVLSCFVKMCEDVDVGLSQFDMSARHYAAGSVEKFAERKVGETGGASYAERWNVGARESGSVDVASHACHCGGVEHGVYARFCVVAHDESAELKSGVDEPA